MRYSEFNGSRAWKRFKGQQHECVLSSKVQTAIGNAEYGVVYTGKTETFYGYFCHLTEPSGGEWLGEDRYSLREAIRAAGSSCADDGWTLHASGLSDDFSETGLSLNTGWGYYLDVPDAIHMLAPPTTNHETAKQILSEI